MTPATSRTAAPPNPDPVSGEAWIEHMRDGNFAAAWKISDAVLDARRGRSCRHWPRHLQYVWNGTPLAGKRVLIRCYHGLGDTVQYVRYAPFLRAVAREVVWWVQPELIALLGTVRGVDHLLPLHDGMSEADYDVDVESMELAHVFRTTAENFPREVPYLHVAPAPETRSGRDDSKLNVGLVWQAGGWDVRRSVPLVLLAPLLKLDGIRIHVLQRGPALMEWQNARGVMAGSDRPEQAAATILSLDLMVAVDSFPAHLAGALGVPVWLMLHANPDWRWMRDRSDTPWYPTMRLFRQRRAGQWRPVIDEIVAELAQLAGCSPMSSSGSGNQAAVRTKPDEDVGLGR